MTFKEYITQCDQIPVIQTAHSFTRALERGWDEDNLLTFVQDVGYFISTNRSQIEAYGYNEEIFYYDRYFNCGLVATLRRDYKDRNQFIIAIITVYPNNKKYPLHPNTRRMVVDKHKRAQTYDKWGYPI